MWACKKCGYSNYENSNFCQHCGRKRYGKSKDEFNPKTAIILACSFLFVVVILWKPVHLFIKHGNHISLPNIPTPVPAVLTNTPLPSATAKPNYTASPITTTSQPTEILITATPVSMATPIPTPITTPSRKDLDDLGSKIDYPAIEQFLRNYRYAEIRAPRSGWSVYGYKHLLREDNASNPDYNIQDGTPVTVISTKVYGFVCCIIESRGIACWINADYVK